MSPTVLLLHLATLALAAFLLVATALAILFPRRPLLGVSQHWGLQLWWLALLGALPALWLRDWVLFVLCLAVAGYWSLRLFARRPAPVETGQHSGTPPLRILSANLLHANGDFARALSAIAAQDADVVVLCEATPEARAAFRALDARYPFALDTCVQDGLYGIIILSRFPLSERSRGIGEDPPPRHLAADLALDGAHVSLLAIHPTNPLRIERARRIPGEFAAAAELCNRLRRELILTGDCNAAGWSSYLRALERATGLANDGGLRPSWPVWLPAPLRLPLDHVWVRGGLSLRRARLGRRFGSDHLPLVADVAVPTGVPSPVPGEGVSARGEATCPPGSQSLGSAGSTRLFEAEMSAERQYAQAARAWPFEEARKLLARYQDAPPAKGYVLFETGYGPSGLPHIGTFGEVVRTTMVRRAFQRLSDIPTRLFAFSDDMDGLRKVPTNVPNQEMLAEHLGKPLTKVPDPFGTHESFGHHNNARLRAFLDSFGFEYEFQSATECYTSGRFDAALLEVLRHYAKIMEVMLPSLREERAATYSPFLPVSQKTGCVLQVPVTQYDITAGTITYQDEDGSEVETPVTGGRCKLQWKPDWGMRWHALGVDYEMSGKDLIPSVELGGKICRILGSRPPEGFNYELFLDEKGQKISKSKGNGLSVEEWLEYAPPESLALFMFQKPRAAKRLYFDVIPRAVDEYIAFDAKFENEASAQRLENPVWHIHNGQPPKLHSDLSYGILLNLASVANAEEKSQLWGFITRYRPEATPQTAPFLDKLVGYAINYYRDFVKPAKKFRAPSDVERAALGELLAYLEQAPADADAEALQTEVYEIGKRHPFPELRAWFKALYEVLLGQEQGPRFGSFIQLYGRAETAALIRKALASPKGLAAE